MRGGVDVACACSPLFSCSLRCGYDSDNGPHGGWTVPTQVNHDSGHAVPMRIDYMLANAAFMEAFPARGRPVAVVSKDTQVLSDHFPLLVDLA